MVEASQHRQPLLSPHSAPGPGLPSFPGRAIPPQEHHLSWADVVLTLLLPGQAGQPSQGPMQPLLSSHLHCAWAAHPGGPAPPAPAPPLPVHLPRVCPSPFPSRTTPDPCLARGLRPAPALPQAAGRLSPFSAGREKGHKASLPHHPSPGGRLVPLPPAGLHLLPALDSLLSLPLSSASSAHHLPALGTGYLNLSQPWPWSKPFPAGALVLEPLLSCCISSHY